MKKLKAADHDRPASRAVVWRLLALVGVIYFVQGIVEPTTYLPAQPLQAQLRAWRFSTTQVGHFFGIIGIAWALKPLLAVVSDFFPIVGRRRWPYLIASTALATAAFAGLAACWGRPVSVVAGHWSSGWFGWLMDANPADPDLSRFGWLLIIAGIGLAMTDVVIDAWAVETGQPLGITGQIQSVQWGALSVAGLFVGSLGGYVAAHGLVRPMFQACGLLALTSLVCVLVLVREPRHLARPRENMRRAAEQLGSGQRIMILLSAAAFLFLWNFNPFSNNVLQTYMTEDLGFGQQYFGHLSTMVSAANIVACLAYATYCRRVPLGWLIHGSIVGGIISTLCYWLLIDSWSAVLVSIVFGFTYQTGLLIQLDLAARICPTQSAGTSFALLMAIGNAGLAAGVYLGGGWYDALTEHFHGNRHLAFQTLVGVGAAFTAGCWLIVPIMKRAGVRWD